MRYFMMRGNDQVLWRADDGGSSGVLHPGEIEPVVPGAPVWSDYLAWCRAGNRPEVCGVGPAPSIEQAHAQATARLHVAVDLALQPILAQYPSTEVATWPEQVAEATAWQANPSAPTPLLDAIADGDDKADLCAGVLAKAAQYKRASGAVIAWRRAMSDWIDAQTEVDVLANWQPQFPEGPA